MRIAVRKIAAALAAVAVIGIASVAASTSAEARWGHHHGGWGWGPGFAGGVFLGSALAAPYYYGGPYAYDYDDYGPGCYIQRRVHINRYGEEVVRRVRVCG